MPEDSLVERDRHDGDAVACLLAPEVHATGNFFAPAAGSALSMRGYDRVVFEILGGAANNALATLDVAVQQCNTAAGGGPKALAGLYGTKAITQIVAGAGFATLNQLCLIEVSTEEMDVDAGFDWLRLSMTITGAYTWALAVKALRSGADYEPVATTNITQIIRTSA